MEEEQLLILGDLAVIALGRLLEKLLVLFELLPITSVSVRVAVTHFR